MPQELASVPGIFRTVLLVLLLFFAARILGRILLPFINGQKGRPGNYPNNPPRPEGDVRIEKTKSATGSQRSQNDQEGDYVDYKEVR